MELILTPREQKVLRSFQEESPATIAILAKLAFPGKGTAGISKGNSMTRNSLRKLVKVKLVKQTGRGTYAITKNGVTVLTSM
jgi:hypothetical protein